MPLPGREILTGEEIDELGSSWSSAERAMIKWKSRAEIAESKLQEIKKHIDSAKLDNPRSCYDIDYRLTLMYIAKIVKDVK